MLDKCIISISVGFNHACALSSDGHLFSWGNNDFGKLGLEVDDRLTFVSEPMMVLLENVVSVSCGRDHTVVLLGDGQVFAWGRNIEGQIGIGSFGKEERVPVRVGIEGVKMVGCGFNHTLAILDDGSCYAWGLNTSGQLGTRTQDNEHSPLLIKNLCDVISIEFGGDHTIAKLADGSLYSWGRNWHGQLGIGDTLNKNYPQKIDYNGELVAFSCGATHSVAMDKFGDLYSWGDNSFYQLGSTENIIESQNVPKKVDYFSNANRITSLICGLYHTFAMDDYGDLYAWGRNDYGQLGSDREKYPHFKKPRKTQFSNIESIVCGGFCIAKFENGYYYKWGTLNPDHSLIHIPRVLDLRDTRTSKQSISQLLYEQSIKFKNNDHNFFLVVECGNDFELFHRNLLIERCHNFLDHLSIFHEDNSAPLDLHIFKHYIYLNDLPSYLQGKFEVFEILKSLVYCIKIGQLFDLIYFIELLKEKIYVLLKNDYLLDIIDWYYHWCTEEETIHNLFHDRLSKMVHKEIEKSLNATKILEEGYISHCKIGLLEKSVHKKSHRRYVSELKRYHETINFYLVIDSTEIPTNYHKLLIHSNFFEALLKYDLKEGSTHIEINMDISEPTGLLLLLQFIQTSDLPLHLSLEHSHEIFRLIDFLDMKETSAHILKPLLRLCTSTLLSETPSPTPEPTPKQSFIDLITNFFN